MGELPVARKIHIVARILRRQPIVGGVVHAAHRQSGTELVAFGGVVVDHVENHFNATGVQSCDHHLKLLHRVLGDVHGGIATVGGKKSEGIIAPIIAEPPLEEMPIVEKVVHREELDGRDPQIGQMADGGFRSKPGISAAQRLRYLRMQFGEAFHVHLVDEGLMPWGARWAVIPPGKGCIDDHRQRRIGGAVPFVEG